MRESLARIGRATRERVARLSPFHARRRRFNLHLQDKWQGRAEQAVEMWLRSADRLAGAHPLSVGDLGCGNERVRVPAREPPRRRLHVPGIRPAAAVEGGDQARCEARLPDREFDVVFALGLLEYLPDLEDFLARLRRICTLTILSYAVLDSAEPLGEPEREARGWRTHYTRGQLEALSERAGWVAEDFVLVERGRTGIWLRRSARR